MLASVSHSSLFRFLMGRSTTTTPNTDFHFIFPAMKTNVNKFSSFGSHVKILKVYLCPIIGYIKAFIPMLKGSALSISVIGLVRASSIGE